eukprot:3917190-Prymnesium_polylepis.1
MQVEENEDPTLPERINKIIECLERRLLHQDRRAVAHAEKQVDLSAAVGGVGLPRLGLDVAVLAIVQQQIDIERNAYGIEAVRLKKVEED